MVASMKVRSVITCDMGRVKKSGQMEPYSKGNFKTMSNMVMVNSLGQMKKLTKESTNII